MKLLQRQRITTRKSGDPFIEGIQSESFSNNASPIVDNNGENWDSFVQGIQSEQEIPQNAQEQDGENWDSFVQGIQSEQEIPQNAQEQDGENWDSFVQGIQSEQEVPQNTQEQDEENWDSFIQGIQTEQNEPQTKQTGDEENWDSFIQGIQTEQNEPQTKQAGDEENWDSFIQGIQSEEFSNESVQKEEDEESWDSFVQGVKSEDYLHAENPVKEEADDWDSFVSGVSQEITSRDEYQDFREQNSLKKQTEQSFNNEDFVHPAMKNVLEEQEDPKYETIKKEQNKRNTETKTFHGRGLILTEQELALEEAIKKEQSKDDEKDKKNKFGKLATVTRTRKIPDFKFKETSVMPIVKGKRQKFDYSINESGQEVLVSIQEDVENHDIDNDHGDVIYDDMNEIHSEEDEFIPDPGEFIYEENDHHEHEGHNHEENDEKHYKIEKSNHKLLVAIIFLPLLIFSIGYIWFQNGGEAIIRPYWLKTKNLYVNFKKEYFSKSTSKKKNNKEEKNINKKSYAILYKEIQDQIKKEPDNWKGNIKSLNILINKIKTQRSAKKILETAHAQRSKMLKGAYTFIKTEFNKLVRSYNFEKVAILLNTYQIKELEDKLFDMHKQLNDRAQKVLAASLAKAQKIIVTEEVKNYKNIKKALFFLEQVNANQLPEIKVKLKKSKGQLLKPFVRKCIQYSKYMQGVQYLANLFKFKA